MSAANTSRGGATKEAAEKALRERDQLYRHYRAAKRSHRQNLYAEHPMGWRLKEFARQLSRFTLPDAAVFLSYVMEENRSWLLTAPPDIRSEALSLVNERIMRIRQAHGLLPLDDPLPFGEEGGFGLAALSQRAVVSFGRGRPRHGVASHGPAWYGAASQGRFLFVGFCGGPRLGRAWLAVACRGMDRPRQGFLKEREVDRMNGTI